MIGKKRKEELKDLYSDLDKELDKRIDVKLSLEHLKKQSMISKNKFMQKINHAMNYFLNEASQRENDHHEFLLKGTTSKH